MLESWQNALRQEFRAVTGLGHTAGLFIDRAFDESLTVARLDELAPREPRFITAEEKLLAGLLKALTPERSLELTVFNKERRSHGMPELGGMQTLAWLVIRIRGSDAEPSMTALQALMSLRDAMLKDPVSMEKLERFKLQWDSHLAKRTARSIGLADRMTFLQEILEHAASGAFKDYWNHFRFAPAHERTYEALYGLLIRCLDDKLERQRKQQQKASISNQLAPPAHKSALAGSGGLTPAMQGRSLNIRLSLSPQPAAAALTLLRLHLPIKTDKLELL